MQAMEAAKALAQAIQESDEYREYVRLMCERMKKAAIGMAAARPDEAAYNEYILALIGEKWKL